MYTQIKYTKRYKMVDLFENIVLCKDCGKRMQKIDVVRNGFDIRALQCPACSKKVYHPADIEEYKKFNSLKHKFFHVKLRMVGNSYAISIPREIIDFFKETEEIEKKMERMVTLALEEAGKLSLMFGMEEEERFLNKDHMKRIKIR